MASKPEPRRGPARGKRAAEAVAGMAEVAAEEQAVRLGGSLGGATAPPPPLRRRRFEA